VGDIIAPPSASRDVVLTNLGAVHDRFRDDMFDPLWAVALRFGIDPVGMVAQADKETDGGAYTGQVRPNQRNTCGLKIAPDQQALFPGITDDDHPLAHDMSGSWFEAAWKHAEHLWAWCGLIPLKLPDGMILDKRFQAVRSLLPTKGAAKTWADLGGRWAPSPTYGIEVEVKRRHLTGG
jgi:N-acetylmuramoyl-L-alanine amidase